MDAIGSAKPRPGLFLAKGGTRERLLPRLPLPEIALASTDARDIRALLAYAGARYSDPASPAAHFGVLLFTQARDSILAQRFDAVTFDWDHTFSNYLIFEDLPQLLKVRRLVTPPPAELARVPLVAIETTRPFMVELALGMMVGFALRQGLTCFSQWRSYTPRVGIASLTWPDRLARLAAHYVPILSLMEAMVPGDAGVYERLISSPRCAIHLHHFMRYGETLLQRFETERDITAAEGHALLMYFKDGCAHHRKPFGAWAASGWPGARLLHVDDSTSVVADLAHQSGLTGASGNLFIHVPHPHSRIFSDVREWHKISVNGFLRSRTRAMSAVVETLVRQEQGRSGMPHLMKALGFSSPILAWPRRGLPHGAGLTFHETPTTLGEFWSYYVAPTSRLRALIHSAVGARGGLSRLRRTITQARAVA